MGSAASSPTMSSFATMTENQYNSLSFPATPPPYKEAMDLARRFGSFDLDGEENYCTNCGKGVAKERSMSFDLVKEYEEESKEDKDDNASSVCDDDPRRLPFSYEGHNYCALQCFFDKHQKKPGMCMYVDKLATLLFERSKLPLAYVDTSDDDMEDDDEDRGGRRRK
mmetsp:Transcript_3062/g.6444  ORF Transcript_3062/g.6444 Transcript_3062/m.6444 type:complete len:167 (+) Transcript_3062:236-736(+)